MSHCEGSISKATIIGWVITVVLSVSASYATINARVYEVEKQIELLKLQQSNTDEVLNEIRPMFVEIKESIAELKALKADKKFTN